MAFVKIENTQDLFKITLTRPEVRNAFHPEMIRELTEAFQQAQKSSARLVFLSGEGKSFCAGADLDWMRSMKSFTREQNIADSEKLHEMFQAAFNCDLPVLTQVQGHVMGGALGLLAVSDFVAVSSETIFCFSEVKLGLAPAVISPFILAKMQVSFACNMMISGQTFSAQEALSSGLVSFVGSKEETHAYLTQVAQSLFASGPQAIRATKKLLRDVQDVGVLGMKSKTTQVIAERRVSDEGQAGLNAFFAQIPPNWKKDFHGEF